MAFELKSDAFAASGNIPRQYTCDGADTSPALSWTGAPKGAKALALIVDDPDAPSGTFVHWVMYDIPASADHIREGNPASGRLPDGSAQGANDFRKIGYSGPCPPKGPPHRYSFRLHALDAPTGLEPGATKAALEKAMQGHVLGRAELVGKYQR